MTRKAKREAQRPSTGAGPPPNSVPENLTPLSPGRILLLASAFAVWAGLFEDIIVLVVKSRATMIHMSQDFLWMTPLADLTLFFLVGWVLLALGRILPHARNRSFVTGVFTGLAALAIGLALEGLHPAATVLLAMGVGTQASRWTRGPARRPRALPVSIGVGVVLLGGVFAWGELEEQSAHRFGLSQLGEPRAGAPNLVLLILDTVRGASLDFLGDLRPQSEVAPVSTPALEGLATRSVLFTKAVAPSPWTLPSHGSMFTGRWAHRLSGSEWLGAEADLGLDRHMTTLAEVLRGEGYQTGGFVGNLIWTFADTGLGRGFLTYEDYETSPAQIFLSSSIGRRLAATDWLWRLLGYHEVLNRKDARTVLNQFLSWQEGHQDRPFFAFLNFFDAHEPHFPTDSVMRTMPPDSRWDDFTHSAGVLVGAWAERNNKWDMDSAEREAHSAGYHAALLRMDAEVQRMLEELDRRGALENTIIIIAGDHGEQLGEHNLFGHDNSLYLPSLHVPLMVFDGRGDATPRRVESVVSLREIAATILEFAGVDASSVGIGGNSLARFWTDRTEELGDPPEESSEAAFSVLYGERGVEPWYPAERGPAMYSLVDSAYHYILNGDGTEELFDLRSDPSEMFNLAHSSSHEVALGVFRNTILELVPEIWGGRR